MHCGRKPLAYWFSSIHPNPHFPLVLSLCRCCTANVSIHHFRPIQNVVLGGGKSSVLQIAVLMQMTG